MPCDKAPIGLRQHSTRMSCIMCFINIRYLCLQNVKKTIFCLRSKENALSLRYCRFLSLGIKLSCTLAFHLNSFMDLNGFDHFLFFIICILLPGLSLMSANAPELDFKPELPAKKHIYFSNGLMMWIGALLVVTNWNLSDRSWELLGIQMPVISSTVLILCGLLFLIYSVDSIYNILRQDKEESDDPKAVLEQILPENWKEYSQFVFLAISAGVCEEFIYRGFLVNYFLEYTKVYTYGPYLAILIPAVIFAISHIYQGWFSVVKIFSLALLFCGIFLFSKSLLLVILIHVFVDMMSGALVVIMTKRKNIKSNQS